MLSRLGGNERVDAPIRLAKKRIGIYSYGHTCSLSTVLEDGPHRSKLMRGTIRQKRGAFGARPQL